MKLREVQMLGILALIAVAIVLLCMWGGEDRPQQAAAVAADAPFGGTVDAVSDTWRQVYEDLLGPKSSPVAESTDPDERESTIEIGSDSLLEPSTEEAQLQGFLDDALPDEIPLAPSSPTTSDTDEAAPARPQHVAPRTHVVLAGDTLSRISTQYYGTTAHWRKIHEANKDVLSDPDALTVGMQLKIPAISASTPEAPKGERTTATGNFHVVQKGESLYRIAEKYYGSGDEENRLKIVEANRKLIADESRIREGIRLLIP
jgi:nucleoid-associated protein YgaU